MVKKTDKRTMKFPLTLHFNNNTDLLILWNALNTAQYIAIRNNSQIKPISTDWEMETKYELIILQQLKDQINVRINQEV